MCDELTEYTEPIRTKKHKRKVAANPIERWESAWECFHIRALEVKPWEVMLLGDEASRDLSNIAIDGIYLPRWADVFCDIECRNATPARDVEDRGTGKEIKMVEEQFGKWG